MGPIRETFERRQKIFRDLLKASNRGLVDRYVQVLTSSVGLNFPPGGLKPEHEVEVQDGE